MSVTAGRLSFQPTPGALQDKASASRNSRLAAYATMLSMTSVKVSRKNQIAVPAAVRRRLGIRAGDRLAVQVQGSRVILIPEPRSVVDELAAIAPEIWGAIDAGTYIRELRDEWSPREP